MFVTASCGLQSVQMKSPHTTGALQTCKASLVIVIGLKQSFQSQSNEKYIVREDIWWEDSLVIYDGVLISPKPDLLPDVVGRNR